MQFADVNEILEPIPYTGTRKGKFLYDFVKAKGISSVLELGFAHGASTCYIAAALAEAFNGHIDAVDLIESADFKPTLEELSASMGLSSLISVHREVSSYTWFLKKKIEEQTGNSSGASLYDLVFIDGPKDWTNDGASFFMADKLLRPGGWIIFDDYAWAYRAPGETREDQQGYVFRRMSPEEFYTPHVEAIFRLLVTQHPSYSNFEVVDDTLAIARKSPNKANTPLVKLKSSVTLSYLAFAAGRPLARALRRRRT